MAEIFPVWTVHCKNDDRSLGPVTGVCSDKKSAEKIAQGSGWYGGDAPVCERWAVKINEDVYLLESIYAIDLDGALAEKKKELQKKALAKLSQDEIEALGIDLNSMED